MELGYDNWYDNSVAGGSPQNGTLRPKHCLARGHVHLRNSLKAPGHECLLMYTFVQLFSYLRFWKSQSRIWTNLRLVCGPRGLKHGFEPSCSKSRPWNLSTKVLSTKMAVTHYTWLISNRAHF